MALKIFYLISIIFTVVSSEPFRFDNYTLYKVLPKNLKDVEYLQELQNAAPEFDFWDDPVPTADYVNIVSKPELKKDLESFLASNKIDFVITQENIQE